MILALTGAMLMGVIVGLTVMIGSYHALGAATAKVNPAQVGVGGWETWNRALSWQSAPKGPQPTSWLMMAFGLLLCIGMGLLGNAWLGSPFRSVTLVRFASGSCRVLYLLQGAFMAPSAKMSVGTYFLSIFLSMKAINEGTQRVLFASHYF